MIVCLVGQIVQNEQKVDLQGRSQRMGGGGIGACPPSVVVRKDFVDQETGNSKLKLCNNTQAVFCLFS